MRTLTSDACGLEVGEENRTPLSAWELQGRLVAPCLYWACGLFRYPLVRLVDGLLLDLMARIWHAPRHALGLCQA